MLNKFMYCIFPCDIPDTPLVIGITHLELEYLEEPGVYGDVADLLDYLETVPRLGLYSEKPTIRVIAGPKEGPKPEGLEELLKRKVLLEDIIDCQGFYVEEDEDGENSPTS